MKIGLAAPNRLMSIAYLLSIFMAYLHTHVCVCMCVCVYVCMCVFTYVLMCGDVGFCIFRFKYIYLWKHRFRGCLGVDALSQCQNIYVY